MFEVSKKNVRAPARFFRPGFVVLLCIDDNFLLSAGAFSRTPKRLVSDLFCSFSTTMSIVEGPSLFLRPSCGIKAPVYVQDSIAFF